MSKSVCVNCNINPQYNGELCRDCWAEMELAENEEND